MPHAMLRGGGSSCAWPAPFRPAAPATLPAVLHLNARMHQWPRRTDTSDDVRRYVILRIPRSDGRAHSCFRPDAGAQQHCGKPCTAHRDRSNHHGFKTDGFVTPPSPPARAGGCSTLDAGDERLRLDRQRRGQHHRARSYRHGSDGRSAALGHRYHGHFRDRLDPGRAPGHRADQRRRRHPWSADQGDPGGRRLRLADLRREGQEAAGARQCSGGVRLLDLGFAQGGAADLRAGERVALLPDLL